ncbi:hypothetical protein PtB15_18B451 [Puccinia triticina]|nr:hypothetical protein PtB15_18B451 [Puccinia triticina]
MAPRKNKPRRVPDSPNPDPNDGLMLPPSGRSSRAPLGTSSAAKQASKKTSSASTSQATSSPSTSRTVPVQTLLPPHLRTEQHVDQQRRINHQDEIDHTRNRSSPASEDEDELPEDLNQQGKENADLRERRTETIKEKRAEVADIDTIKSIFNLNSDAQDLADQILDMNEASQRAAIIYDICERKSRGHQITPTLINPTSTQEEEIDHWQPSEVLKNKIKDFIHETIYKCNLIAYSAFSDPSGHEIRDSLFVLCSNFVLQSSAKFKEEYLPAGFGDDEDSDEKVFSLVKKLARYERQSFRDALVFNIIETSSSLVVGPVPSIHGLVFQIHKAFSPKGRSLNYEKIVAETDATARARFAYIRLAFAKYYMETAGTKKKKTPWTPVDNFLISLQKKTPNYRVAWGQCILEKDHALFGSGQTQFESLPDDVDLLPTEEEIQELIAYNESTE